MSSTSGIDQFFQPLTLDGLNAFTQSVQDNALLIDGSNAMLADLDMSAHTIKNLADGLLSTDAATKGQVDAVAQDAVDAIDAEVARATAAEAAIAGDLADEVARATAAESYLSGDLADEVARATAAEAAITSTISGLTSNYVTLGTTQTITGEKQFNGKIGLDALDLTPTFTEGGNIDYTGSQLSLKAKGLNGIALKCWSSTMSEPSDPVLQLNNSGYFGSPRTDGGLFLNGSSDIWLNVGSNTLYSKVYQDTTSNKLVVNSFESTGGGIVSFNSGKLVGGVESWQEVLRVGGDAVTALKPLAMSSNKVTGLANGSLATDAAAVGQVLLLNGTNTMAANLAMGSNKVTGMANGSLASDAAAVGQVLLLNGTNTMAANLAMGSNRITGLAPSVNGTDAVNRDELTGAVYIETTQTVATNVFTINDSTPTVTLLDFNGGLVSLPATGVSVGKVLRFINIYNGSNAASLWSNTGLGSIDGVTGAQQLVRLEFGQSVTFVARGSGAYSVVAIDLLPPHARVKCDYGSNDIGLWTWDGNALNSTTERMRVGSSAITGYVPFAPRAWSAGQVMKSWIFNTATSGSAIKTCPNGVVTDWKTFSVTSCLSSVKGNWSSTYLCLHLDVPYHVTGDGVDNFIVDVYDVTNGGAQIIMRKSQYYDGQGGGGTRACPMFPLVASWRPSHNTGVYTRSVRVRINNQSGLDTVYMGAGVDGGTVTNLNFDYFTARFEEISV